MANVINRTTLEQKFSVNTPDYPVDIWIINPDMSNVVGVPKKYWKIEGDLVLEMNQAEKDAVDAAHLGQHKLERYIAIDVRTDELISEGFEFPDGYEHYYSLSAEGQLNILGAYTAKDSPYFAYPIKWPTILDDYELSINNAATLEAFYLTAVGTVRVVRDSGTVIKEAIRAATTTAEVDAIVDPR